MRILVTGAWKCTQEQKSQLEKQGHEIILMTIENGPLPCDYEFVEGVICNGLFLYHPIEKFTSLRYIQLTSAGYDRVPLDYIKEHGIEIYNARGVYSIPMAEFAVCGVLQFYKQSTFFAKNKIERNWIKNRELIELYGKKVCIVGCGNVGDECAKRFSALGCKVLGVDILVREDTNYEKIVPLRDLMKVMPETDVLILTLPLTWETRHIINTQVFNAMKQGALLINISRGEVVDTTSLISALKTKLMGAVLDVFEQEPLPKESELWAMDNIIITPHNSFVGEGNNRRLSGVIFSNLDKGR